jgi:hypothetical protein
MPWLRRDVIWQIAERECFRFHFQLDLRVNVRGVQGDMPEPSHQNNAMSTTGTAKLMCSQYQEDALIAGGCETIAT